MVREWSRGDAEAKHCDERTQAKRRGRIWMVEKLVRVFGGEGGAATQLRRG
jgi:hypothetical protein